MTAADRRFIPSLRDDDTPRLKAWFFKYIGKDIKDFSDDHPLRIYYREYEIWWIDKFSRKSDFGIPIPPALLEFGNFMKGVEFCRVLIDPVKVKAKFISNILDKNDCYGLMFEIRVLMNLFNSQKCGYLENLIYQPDSINGKYPDMSFTKSREFKSIYLECTRKRNREIRCDDDEVLIRDLIWAIKDKAESYKVIEAPLIYIRGSRSRNRPVR